MSDSDYPLLPRAILGLIALGMLLLTDPAGVAPWFKRDPSSEADAVEAHRRRRGIRRVIFLGLAILPTFGALAFRHDPLVFWGCIGLTLWSGYRAFAPPPPPGEIGGTIDPEIR